MKPSWKAEVRPRRKRLTSSSVLQQRSISLTTSLRSCFKAGSPHSQQTKSKSLHFSAPSNEYVNWAESQKEIFVEVSDMNSFYLKIPRLLSKLYTSDNPFYLVQGVEEGKGVS